MNNINWKNCKQFKDGSIEKVEKIWGVRFPVEFTACVKKFNGGYPSPSVFKSNGIKESVNNFLSFNEDDVSYILGHYEDVKEYLPEKVFPFARDAADNLFCFDYRNCENPTIIFWDYEIAFKSIVNSIKELCNTFADFLEMLQ